MSARPVCCSLISGGLMLLLSACTDGSAAVPVDGSGSGDTGWRADAGANTDTRWPIELAPFTGGNPAFTAAHARAQGYWYSRYNLDAFFIGSGAGETFALQAPTVQAMVEMVSDDLSQAQPPKNPALLERVFSSASPELADEADGDPLDLGDARWNVSPDTSTTGEAFGWALTAQVEWARQFHVEARFGVPGDEGQNADQIPGAQQRFAGLVFAVAAINQVQAFNENREAFDLSRPSDQYLALMGIADLVLLLEAKQFSVTEPNNNVKTVAGNNRYRVLGEMLARRMGMADLAQLLDQMRNELDKLYEALPEPVTLRDRCLVAQVLPWYAAARKTNADAAKASIRALAEQIKRETPAGVVERAWAIRALISAGRALNEGKYIDAATPLFRQMIADYDGANAVFKSATTYTTEQLGAIFGAINGVLIYDVSTAVDAVEQMFTDFFENAIAISTLQRAAPSAATGIPDYEKMPDKDNVDPLFYRYGDTMAEPAKAGGANGTAPVFQAHIGWEAGEWTVSDAGFDTAGAFHLASELLWSQHHEVNGFPVLQP